MQKEFLELLVNNIKNITQNKRLEGASILHNRLQKTFTYKRSFNEKKN